MPYNKELLQAILLESDCRTLDDQGAVLRPSDPVYGIIARRMEQRGSHIQPRHVYTIVNENRNGFRVLIESMYKINLKKNKTISSYNSISRTHFGTDVSSDVSQTAHSKKFRLVLSESKWLEIIPKRTVYGGRAYYKLQKGWTYVIAEKICQQHSSVDCVFCFKNNVVAPSGTGKNYLVITGLCSECSARITATLQTSPLKDVDVIFSCQIENIRKDLHTGTGKRQLRGCRREKISNEMIEQRKDAVTFRRQEAMRLKKFGGKNLPIIPNAAVLRKAKEQQLLKIHGLEFANPPMNLLHQSKCGRYAGSIHSIGLLKFHCIYWSPEQKQIYIARWKKDANAILTIDATGGIAKRCNGKKDPHVFLYQCMLVTQDGSIPVFQMVSGDQRSFQISNFLRLILTKGIPCPRTVVCDFGRALINSIAEIFGRCKDLPDYLQQCYNVVFHGSTEMPATYIRLDVSHLIAMVSRWKCLKTKVCAVRRLYLRCVAQAYQMCDFKKLACLLQSILVVSVSEYIGNTKDGVAVPAERHMQILNKTIEGSTVDIIEEDDKENIDSEDSNDDTLEDQVTVPNWKTWAHTICASAKEIGNASQEGTVINACFNPDFADRLKNQLLPYVPLWTGVMRQHFGRGSSIATSSSVEAEFRDVKHRAFKNQLPMRIDKFVLQHLDYLDGKVKLASNESDISSFDGRDLTKVPKSPENSSTLNRTIPDCKIDFVTPVINLTSSEKQRSEIDFDEHFDDIRDSALRNLKIEQNEKQVKSIEKTKKNERTEKTAIIDKNSSFTQDSLRTDPSALEKGFRTSTPNNAKLWNEVENWFGLVPEETQNIPDPETKSPVKKRKKPTYLDKCPEWQYVKDTKISKLPMFRNGSLCNPVSIEKCKLNIIRTCAFDSLFQVIINGIASNKIYCEKLESSVNLTIKLALKTLEHKKGITVDSYRERAQILSNLRLFATKSFTRTIKRLDTECNVGHLAQYLFSDVPSYETKVSCPCGYQFSTQGIILNIHVDVLLCQGFGFMQQAIDDGKITKRTCRKCRSSIQDEVQYGVHLIIDVSVLTDERYTTRNKDIRHTLDSIAKTVEINRKIYSLAGLVHWSPGHYTGYAKSGMYWHEYDDVGPSCQSVNPKSEIQPHLILYVISGEQK